MIDYKILLEKYMAHVEGSEGIVFLDFIHVNDDLVGCHSKVSFTREEFDALLDIEETCVRFSHRETKGTRDDLVAPGKTS